MRKHLWTNIMQILFTGYGVVVAVQNGLVGDWFKMCVAIAGLTLATVAFSFIRYQEDLYD